MGRKDKGRRERDGEEEEEDGEVTSAHSTSSASSVPTKKQLNHSKTSRINISRALQGHTSLPLPSASPLLLPSIPLPPSLPPRHSHARLKGHWVLDPVITNTNRCRDSTHYVASLKLLTFTLSCAALHSLNYMSCQLASENRLQGERNRATYLETGCWPFLFMGCLYSVGPLQLCSFSPYKASYDADPVFDNLPVAHPAASTNSLACINHTLN